jgi:hypothetical protein
MAFLKRSGREEPPQAAGKKAIREGFGRNGTAHRSTSQPQGDGPRRREETGRMIAMNAASRRSTATGLRALGATLDRQMAHALGSQTGIPA